MYVWGRMRLEVGAGVRRPDLAPASIVHACCCIHDLTLQHPPSVDACRGTWIALAVATSVFQEHIHPAGVLQAAQLLQVLLNSSVPHQDRQHGSSSRFRKHTGAGMGAGASSRGFWEGACLIAVESSASVLEGIHGLHLGKQAQPGFRIGLAPLPGSNHAPSSLWAKGPMPAEHLPASKGGHANAGSQHSSVPVITASKACLQLEASGEVSEEHGPMGEQHAGQAHDLRSLAVVLNDFARTEHLIQTALAAHASSRNASSQPPAAAAAAEAGRLAAAQALGMEAGMAAELLALHDEAMGGPDAVLEQHWGGSESLRQVVVVHGALCVHHACMRCPCALPVRSARLRTGERGWLRMACSCSPVLAPGTLRSILFLTPHAACAAGLLCWS